MNDAFDELEQRLRGAVAARRPAERRPRRLRGHRRAWALVALTMLALSAGALAATRLSGSSNPITRGDQLALDAVLQTKRLEACRLLPPGTGGLAVVPGEAIAAITDALPVLKRAAPLAEQQRTLRALGRYQIVGTVFASSLRTIVISRRLQLLVAVGPRDTSVEDPPLCARARLDRVAKLGAGSTPKVLKRARWRLAQDRATAPAVQIFYLFQRFTPPPHGELAGGGGADPVWAGHPLRPGLPSVTGERDGSRLFVGIASRGAQRVRLATRQTSRLGGLPREVPVVEGFFAITVPRGISRFALLELAGDGHVLRPVNLRQ